VTTVSAPRHGDADPVLAAVLHKRVEAITREMATVLLRTTRSTIFNQVGDFITAVFDARGRTLAQTEYAAIIAFGAQPPLEHIIEYFGDDLADGDVILHNDVYSRGNQNHDLGVFVPVFWKGERVAWTVAKGHQADMGGATAGGYNPRIREVWQEALRIPPVKLYEAGRLRRDLWDLLAANVRLSHIVFEDVKSMVGGCMIGRRRMAEILDRYGYDRFRRHMEYLIEASERQVRAEMSTWPDGTYHGQSVMVSDGWDPGARYRIVCDVTIAGDEIVFDFSSTDDQAPGYTNMPSSSAMGAVRIAFLMLLASGGVEVVPNHGLWAPVRTVFRKGSLLDPRFPAATIFGNQMCDEVVEAIMSALAPALPDRVTAGWNQALGTVYTGVDPRSGEASVFFGSFQRGGPGAMRGADGFDALGFTGAVGQMRSPDVEMYEISHPCLLERYEYTTDSAGAGRWRGGLGTTTVRRMDAERLVGFTLGDDVEAEGAAPAPGLFGGEPAGLNELRIEYPDGRVRLWGSKEMIDDLPPGTRIVSVNGGGAGYGDPMDRSAELVLQEVRDGLLSVEKARRSYGVAVDEATWTVDEPATAALRATARRERW
jgi:N-methylhydantoinase B